MINTKFKKIYELSNELQEKYYKEDYERLSKIEKDIGTFEEYVNNEKKESNRVIPDDRKKQIEDAYILKDSITKEDIVFSLYLVHFMHTDPIEFDENYKPLPLKEKEIFEYGAVVSTTDETGYYSISGVFGGVENDDHIAQDKYNVLKSRIENTSLDELLDEIENSILEQINDKK